MERGFMKKRTKFVIKITSWCILFPILLAFSQSDTRRSQNATGLPEEVIIEQVIIVQDYIYDQEKRYNKPVYKREFGASPDTLRPIFNLRFCHSEFGFPAHLPLSEDMRWKLNAKRTRTETDQHSEDGKVNYTMQYDENGRISRYSIEAAGKISYEVLFYYDYKDRISAIGGTDSIFLEYNDITERDLVKIASVRFNKPERVLKFRYTYAGQIPMFKEE
jgi:hypothetical protein